MNVVEMGNLSCFIALDELPIAYLFEGVFFLGHLSAIALFLGHVSATALTSDIQTNAPVGLIRVAARLEFVRRDPSHQDSSPLIAAQMDPNLL